MQPCYISIKRLYRCNHVKSVSSRKPLAQCFYFHCLLLCSQVLSLESKCQDFQVNITALREEISERESVIAQNYTTIQLLRRRLADMEKHKFVLGYRTQVRQSPLCSCRLCPCCCLPMRLSCACHLGCSSPAAVFDSSLSCCRCHCPSDGLHNNSIFAPLCAFLSYARVSCCLRVNYNVVSHADKILVSTR